MRPTEQLKEEHEAIKLMLSILDKILNKLQTAQTLNTEHFSKVLEFLRGFADKCHHGKEEDLFFPALEEAGIPKEGGPIGVMLKEHTFGRGFIKGMAEAFDEFQKGDKKAAATIIENGRNYILLLTQHIYKENNVLFPMADNFLSEDQQEKLEKAFEKLEAERIGPGKHEEFHKLLHQLKEVYLK